MPALAVAAVEAAVAEAMDSRERWERWERVHVSQVAPGTVVKHGKNGTAVFEGIPRPGAYTIRRHLGPEKRLSKSANVYQGEHVHVRRAAQESLDSRERWARWEMEHGWASRHGLSGRGSSRHPVEPHLEKLGLHKAPVVAKDSRSVHTTARGQYTRERKAVHDQIVNHFLAGHAPAAGRPTALFMAGGAASGKSHALKHNPGMAPHDAVHVNPDAIKEMLPEYKAKLAAGDKTAAAHVHEESSDIAKRLLHEAMARKHHVLIDGTGDSKRGKFTDKLKRMHEGGYDVHATYVTVPTELAVDRTIDRAARTGRHVPLDEVRRAHQNVSAWFHDTARLPFVKKLEVHDTSAGGAPVKIASGHDGKLTVHDKTRFRKFIDKGKGAS